MAWRDVPLRRKLPLIVMVTSSAALLLACGAFLAYDLVVAREATIREMEIMSEIVAAQSVAAVAFDDAKVADEILKPFRTERQVVCAALYHKTGRTLASYRRADSAIGPPSSPEPDGGRDVDGHYVVYRPIDHEGGRVGTLMVRSDMESARAGLRRGMWITALVLAGSSVTALLLSFKLSATVTRPILQLVSTVKGVSAPREYSPAAPGGRDEVGQLIAGFNDMLARIQDRDLAIQAANEELQIQLRELGRTQRELEARVREITTLNETLRGQKAELGTYHDLVTHDVTNFAGTLMGIVEHLLAQPDEKLPPRGRELLQRANRQIFQLNTLAGNAKTLVRLQQGGGGAPGRPVELGGLLSRVVETIRAVHFDRSLRIEADCTANLRMREIPFMDHVLLNLLDNAVRHGAKDAPPVVRVRVAREGAQVRIAVSGGAPLDEALRARVFDRYTRGPHSKGAGLGLAVVREIVERAGGRIGVGTAREPEGEAFEIVLHLPGE